MKWLSGNLAERASLNGSTNAREAIHYKNDGSYSYLDAGLEQDVVSMAASTHYLHFFIWLDVSNLATNGTFKIYYKVDGTNYRHIDALDVTIVGGTTEAIYWKDIVTKYDMKITYTEGADEGAGEPAILYSYIYTAVEIVN